MVVIALAVFPFLVAIDLVQFAAGVRDEFWWPVVVRCIWVGPGIVFYLLLRRGSVPRNIVFAIEVFGFAAVSTSATLVAMRDDGFAGPGTVLVCVAVAGRGALIPRHWKRATTVGMIAFACPMVVLAVLMLSDNAKAEQWSSMSELAVFGRYVLAMLVAVGIGSYGSHVTWSAKRQVREARKLGGYRLKAQIGSGGMGEVWLAWDARLRRDVALKILRAEGPQRRSLSARFVREARVLCRLRSQYSVRVFDFGASDDGILYIVMELLHGEDLAAYVEREGPLDAREAAHLARQAARALEEAHANGIVHRDVKPANMFLTKGNDGQRVLKLIDFGLAKLDDPGATTLTVLGNVPGTPMFMSPEQCRGEKVDARTDIYSLGAAMHFLVTGKPMFDGENAQKIVVAHMHESPKALGRAVPQGFADIVMRCLEKSPRDRFQRAVDLERALSEWLRDPTTSEASGASVATQDAAIPTPGLYGFPASVEGGSRDGDG